MVGRKHIKGGMLRACITNSGCANVCTGQRGVDDALEMCALTADGLARFRQELAGDSYEPVPGRSRRFRERQSGVTVDFLITGKFPGSGEPGPIAFPDPESVAETLLTRICALPGAELGFTEISGRSTSPSAMLRWFIPTITTRKPPVGSAVV